MAEQEVACSDLGHTARHHLVHGLAHGVEQRGAHGLGQAGLQQRHLLDGEPVRAQDRCVDRPGDVLAQIPGRVGPLHQGAGDGLLGVGAAEVVAPRGFFGLVVEDRRVAGVGHEVGQVGPVGQVAGKGRGGVQRDDHRAAGQQGRDLCREFADQGVGHRQDDDLRAFEGHLGIHADRCRVRRGGGRGRPRRVRHGEHRHCRRRGYATVAPHFAASAEQRDCRHASPLCIVLYEGNGMMV